MDPALARKWEAMGIPVLQGYGTTEAAPIVSCNTFKQRKLDSVGVPLPGVQVKITDDGEILIRGENVTQGYWQNPQATQAAFEDGWYKTGDLGYLDKYGLLYFKGRKKDLIVLSSGLNVYPEDIELILKQHPDVADAVVVELPRREQEVQVHAVLLLKDGEGDPKVIVEQTNLKLAEHQRVQGFTVWPNSDFPRTYTLKVKKHQVLERLKLIRVGESPDMSRDEPSAPTINVSPLTRLIANQLRIPVQHVQPSMRLGADLGLDSLGRLELLAAMETELGVVLDESSVSESTTVVELEQLAAKKEFKFQRPDYWDWPLAGPARLVRTALQDVLLAPLLRLFARMKVVGRENLKGVKGPVIFACNHASHLDSPVVLGAIPRGLRAKTAVAAAADYFFQHGVKGAAVAVLYNAFPFSRSGAVRHSIERCGALIDKGWSILVYPEGTRSKTGEIGQFKSGIGLMAVELHVPVVPIHISGTYQMLPKEQVVPSPGRVLVRIGKPLIFSKDTSYIEATKEIEDAVKQLAVAS